MVIHSVVQIPVGVEFVKVWSSLEVTDGHVCKEMLRTSVILSNFLLMEQCGRGLWCRFYSVLWMLLWFGRWWWGLLPNEGLLMDFVNLSLGSSRVVGDSRCARLRCWLVIRSHLCNSIAISPMWHCHPASCSWQTRFDASLDGTLLVCHRPCVSGDKNDEQPPIA